MLLISKPRSQTLTIVQNLPTYKDFRLEGLRDSARDEIHAALAATPTYLNKTVDPLCKYLEVYLFLTGRHINKQRLTEETMLPIALGFIAALNSLRFVDIVPYMRKRYIDAFTRAMTTINPHFSSLGDIKTADGLNPLEIQLTNEFDSQEFLEEKLWILRGWWVENKNGLRSHLPLYEMYKRMGRDFSHRFHEVCINHMKGRSLGNIFGIRALIKFIAENDTITETHLLDRRYISQFWRDFFIEFTQTSYRNGEGMQASTIISGWNNQFVPLIRDAFVPAGLFASPVRGYPNPRNSKTFGAKSNIAIENNIQVKTNLLTRVPLHLTDAEAVQTLFITIRTDVNLIRQWADQETRRIDNCINQRKILETEGVPREIQQPGANINGHKYISSNNNPQALANAAATLKKYGYIPRGEKNLDVRLLFPTPLEKTAGELGLPVTGSLIPYLAVIVAEHPAITTAFLENHQLYNTAGVRTGIETTDGGCYLIGDKLRRGARDAEQQIQLSDKAKSAVEGLIRLTEPIRLYMRQIGDDDWRYLLLSCGKGFGAPYRIRKLSPQMSFKERIKNIAEGIHMHCNISIEQAHSLAKRFSLGRLRTSAGTLVYLETQSVQKMAEALGHKNYEPDLLSRYLPPALQEFFQERWIRIFQNGILAEALKNSDYLLQSTDFQSHEDLTTFLSNHAIKLPPTDEPKSQQIENGSEVLFGLDAGIFSVLLSIERAVTDADAKNKKPTTNALHWAKLTRALVRYVESSSSYREDLKEQLNIAKNMANSESMDGFIYA